MLDFLPINGISKPWLLGIYEKYITRSKAIGRDGVTHSQFRQRLDNELEIIISKVNSQSYSFTRYKEILLSRGHSRAPRQISVPTIRDRLVIRAALEHLKHAFPNALSPPPRRYIKDIKQFLPSCPSQASFLRMDIKDFYPSIHQDYLISLLSSSDLDRNFLNLIEGAIRTPTGDASDPPTEGIPQGLAISNILAAIYLQEFDNIARSEVFYRRYVDDILVVARHDEIATIYSALQRGLANLSLQSHPLGTVGKSEVLSIANGVQYLGYEVAVDRTSIRSESLARMFNNLAKVLTSIRRGKNTARDLYRLDLKISGCIINGARRGWLMFFSQTDDISQLSFLDKWLQEQIANIPQAQGATPKTFKKAYYEIRYNLSDTIYIPNFDKYDLDQKGQVLGVLSNRTPEQIAAMDVEVIEREFDRAIGKQVSELEKDISRAFS